MIFLIFKQLWIYLMWGKTKTHDFSQRGWGWNISWVNDTKIVGIGAGIQSGDVLKLGGRNDIRVVNVKYFDDPADQWTADVYGEA